MIVTLWNDNKKMSDKNSVVADLRTKDSVATVNN
jgi:hypothetical protein